MQKKQRKKEGSLWTRLVTQSFFLYLLGSFTNMVYKWLAHGFFGKIFTSYSSQEKAFQNGTTRGYFTERGSSAFRKIREKISRAFEGSYFLDKFKKISDRLFEMPLRFYGTVLISFGIYSIAVLLARQLITGEYVLSEFSFVISIISIVVSLPLYWSKDNLGEALIGGRITKALFIEAFGFREEDVITKSSYSRKRSNYGIIWGMIAGLLTAVIDAQYIALIVLSVISLLLIFILPELGVLLSLFIIPFCSFLPNPSLVLAGLVIITCLAYALKLVRGKRVFKLELVDGFVIGFAILIFMSGVISAGGSESFATALLCICLMLGYFLIVNLIRTKEWADRCVSAILASGVMTAAFGVLQFVFGKVDNAWLDISYFSSIKGRVVSFFDNPNVLSAYLIIVFPFALSRLFFAKTFKGRVLALLSFASVVACIVLTYSRAAWLAMLTVGIIYGLINSRQTFKWLFSLGFIVPLLPFVLPDSVKDRLMSIGDMSESSNFYRVNLWRGTVEAIKDHLIGGVGFGTKAYEAIYPSYAYAGIESAEHSHSLYLQIVFAMGIFGFLIFAVLLYTFAAKNFEFYKNTFHDSVSRCASSAFCAVVGMLVIGLFDYPWYNYRVFFLFWVAMAISCASVRIGDREMQRQMMVDRYDGDFASIDI